MKVLFICSLVIEKFHRRRLLAMFGSELRDKQPVVLNIRDIYKRMDPELVRILKVKVAPYLKLTPEQRRSWVRAARPELLCRT